MYFALILNKLMIQYMFLFIQLDYIYSVFRDVLKNQYCVEIRLITKSKSAKSAILVIVMNNTLKISLFCRKPCN